MSKIHFIGIGGVGMSALAILLKGEGHSVSGCDLAETARTQFLARLGIPVAIGHDVRHVENVDLVIATPAVHANNPERLASGARLRFRGDVLADLVSRHPDSIAVCGSHGKTTTSTFIAKILRALGESVAWAIGGETGDFPVANFSREKNHVLVVEADESDGTLARYHAKTLVVTNCEYDHPDHFATREDYFACYEIAKKNSRHIIESQKIRDENFSREILAILDSLAPHNRENARAAVEVARQRGYTDAALAKILPSVVSVLPDRRFQFLSRNPVIITDYAHHPTEIACAVQMARKICTGTLRIIFQPHRYSRTKALLANFPDAFEGADELILCPTYSAFEPRQEGGTIADLYRVCREKKNGAKIILAKSCVEAWEHAKFENRENDVTLLLGAGDIIALAKIIASENFAKKNLASENFAKKNLAKFSFFQTGGATVGGGQKIVVGMGSNMWISDATTNREFLRTTAPAGAPGATLGIPWMVGVPGTIGGWVKMNAGAFGHSISELIAKVKVDGVWIAREKCGFGYRESSIRGTIEDVEWNEIFAKEISRKVASDRARETAEFLAKRKNFPARCCGSVFKNPPHDFAGRLLEEAGAKDLRVGGAFVWREHANVIVAGDGATSSDILALAKLMHARVYFRFGVSLEPEIQNLAWT